MFLLKSRKNELFDLIVNAGFDLLQFELKEINATSTTKEITKVTFTTDPKFYFAFYIENGTGLHHVFFKPANESPDTTYVTHGWSTEKESFSLWLQYLKREIEAPDKWQELLEASKSMNWEITE